MPIRTVFYSNRRGDGNDIHLLWGETSRELSVGSLVAVERLPSGAETSHFAAAYPPADIAIEFIPTFRANLVGASYEGFDIRVNKNTGAVSFAAPSPPALFPRNFIIEAVVTGANAGGINTNLIERARIRVHVHPGVTRIWLTPNPMTVRRFTAAGDEDTESRFTVRAEFTDKSVGDITDHHDVSWSPARNVEASGPRTGRLKIDAGDAAGASVAIIATWRSLSATANMTVAPPWAAEPAMPKAELVDGHPDTWAGTINPRIVPNVLVFGDGFTAGDVPKLEPITNMIAHHLKTDRLTRPFDLLATSMNWWRVAVPAPTRGASVRCEVYTWESAGRTWAKALPPALPLTAGQPWTLSTLLCTAGLPIATDALVSDVDLHARWAVTMRDPPPEISSTAPLPALWKQLLSEWKQLSTRTFIDEIDGFPAMALGAPPRAAELSPKPMLSLHPNRGADRGWRSFFPLLRASNNVALDGPPVTNAIGNLWIDAVPTSHFDNSTLVVVLSGTHGGRAQNASAHTLLDDPNLSAQPAHIAMALSSGTIAMPVKAVAGRQAVTLDFFEPMPDSVSRDLWRTMAHELGHSLGLGDEYVDLPGEYTLAEATLNTWGNLTTLAGVTLGGAIDAAAIKWQWHRAGKAAFVLGLPSSAGDALTVPLARAGGFQFTVGDAVFLRQRRWKTVIGRAPITSALLKVTAVDPSGNAVTVSGALGISPATFDDGSVLYAPVPDPAVPGLFLNVVAPKIAKFITDNKRPLTKWPCSATDQIGFNDDGQRIGVSDMLPEFDGYDGFWSHRNDVRTVGLYSGGVRQGCGIFHPAGQCMMRNQSVATNEFCHVCKFVLVELIDVRAHFQIDRDYDAAYPK